MPAKDKIKINLWLTPAQHAALQAANINNLSEYIRGLIAADLADFPNDMPGQGKEGASSREKK